MSTKAQRTWTERFRSAKKLATMGDGDEDKALDLILRTIRYALADAREWERENTSDRYCNSKTAAHRTELLEKRRARLQSEWNAYGLMLVWYGLYPTVTDHEGGSDIIYLPYMD